MLIALLLKSFSQLFEQLMRREVRLNNVPNQLRLSVKMLLEFGFHITYWAITCEIDVSL